MSEPAEDPWMIALVFGIFFGSIAAWISIVAAWRRNGCVLRYEPRQPVPWGPVAIVLPVLLAVLSVTEGVLSMFGEPRTASVEITEGVAVRLAAGILLQTSLAAGFVLAVVSFSRATASDIGLPSSFRQFVQDVGIGVLTCLAAVLPVFAILTGLRWILDIEDVSRHPLVDVVNRSGDAGVLMLASVAAVLVAPVTEELLFRLLLQGYLEKWQQHFFWKDHPLRFQVKHLLIITAIVCVGLVMVDAYIMLLIAAMIVAAIVVWQFFSVQDDKSLIADEVDTVANSKTPLDSTSTLPSMEGRFETSEHEVAWTSIVISSVIFAAAHFGYGPEPVPIFILALFLGYVYQRTHRIVPCMVAHGMFNSISMFMLWRVVVNGG